MKRLCMGCGYPLVRRPQEYESRWLARQTCDKSCAATWNLRGRSKKYRHVDIEGAFWTNVQRGEGCWEWTGGRTRQGYGELSYRSKRYRAHRLSWEIANGRPVPEGMVVCHNCDNPPCVNPDHLRAGTVADNNHDTKIRQRHLLGVRHPAHRLTERQVYAIRREYPRIGIDRLAALAGVRATTVRQVVRRETWRHVP